MTLQMPCTSDVAILPGKGPPMTAQPIFDIRTKVRRRILEYMFVVPMMGLALIGLGLWLLPDSFVFEPSLSAVERVDGWVVVGLALIGAGIYNIFKAVVLALRGCDSSGEWHFRLTQDALLWKVPQHPFGPEVGFDTRLTDITEVEFRTITAYEKTDISEYWVHFRDGSETQLMAYTGVTLSWLVAEIHKAGVDYNETRINR